MFTLKFYHEDGGFEVYQASQFRVQMPGTAATGEGKRVEWEDPVASATFEKFLEPHVFDSMIAENMHGKTTQIVRV